MEESQQDKKKSGLLVRNQGQWYLPVDRPNGDGCLGFTKTLIPCTDVLSGFFYASYQLKLLSYDEISALVDSEYLLRRAAATQIKTALERLTSSSRK